MRHEFVAGMKRSVKDTVHLRQKPQSALIDDIVHVIGVEIIWAADVNAIPVLPTSPAPHSARVFV